MKVFFLICSEEQMSKHVSRVLKIKRHDENMNYHLFRYCHHYINFTMAETYYGPYPGQVVILHVLTGKKNFFKVNEHIK